MKYDAELAERLEREAREDDTTIPAAPWRVTKEHAEASGNRYFPSLLTHEPISFYDRVVINDSITGKPTTMDKYDAIADAMARQRNNLRAIADQLAAARAELALKQGVIDSGNEAFRVAREGWQRELAAARAEIDKMRPLIEHAERERDTSKECTCPNCRRVDAYRAARGKEGA